LQSMPHLQNVRQHNDSLNLVTIQTIGTERVQICTG